MTVGGKRHAPAALPPVPTVHEARWALNLAPPSTIELQAVQPAANRYRPHKFHTCAPEINTYPHRPQKPSGYFTCHQL